MICEKCNKNIDYDAKFCYFCGYKIEKKSEEVEIYTNSGPFEILCQLGKIENTKGHKYENRNRCRAIC